MRQTDDILLRCARLLSSHLFLLSMLVLSLSSCGEDRGHFRIEGELKGINQGELYIYGTSEANQRLDTIAIRNGQFAYKTDIDTTDVLVIVFPNFSELPLVATPGITAKIKGDASHLKETTVKGSKENEQLTAFRLQTADLTPPERTKAARAFVEEHPGIAASQYLDRRYPAPNKKPADRLPKFSAKDTQGRTASNGQLKGQANVITTWATWNYESQNLQRQLRRLEKQYGSDRLRLVSICLDPDRQACTRQTERDSITWSNICSGQAWDTPLIAQLGLHLMPDIILADKQGRILARTLTANELKQKIDSIMSQ